MVFFDMPNWLAMSSMETERIPYRRNSSFAFSRILTFVFPSVIIDRRQNYRNFFRYQSFHPHFLTVLNKALTHTIVRFININGYLWYRICRVLIFANRLLSSLKRAPSQKDIL